MYPVTVALYLAGKVGERRTGKALEGPEGREELISEPELSYTVYCVSSCYFPSMEIPRAGPSSRTSYHTLRPRHPTWDIPCALFNYRPRLLSTHSPDKITATQQEAYIN